MNKSELTRILLALSAGIGVVTISPEPISTRTWFAAAFAAITGYLSPSKLGVKK